MCLSEDCFGTPNSYIGLPSTATFKEFLLEVDKRRRSAGNRGLCSIEHHLCEQVSSCVVGLHEATINVLKLEEMASWYPCLVEDLSLSMDALRGNNWTPFSGRPCFYTPTGNCSDFPSERTPRTTSTRKTSTTSLQITRAT